MCLKVERSQLSWMIIRFLLKITIYSGVKLVKSCYSTVNLPFFDTPADTLQIAFLDLTEVDQANSIALSAVEQHDIAGVGISIEKPIHKDLFSVDPHQPRFNDTPRSFSINTELHKSW